MAIFGGWLCMCPLIGVITFVRICSQLIIVVVLWTNFHTFNNINNIPLVSIECFQHSISLSTVSFSFCNCVCALTAHTAKCGFFSSHMCRSCIVVFVPNLSYTHTHTQARTHIHAMAVSVSGDDAIRT